MIERAVDLSSEAQPDAHWPVARSVAPVAFCVCVYSICILFSAAVIYRIAGFDTVYGVSTWLILCGRWLPVDSGWVKDAFVSRQDTGYIELLILLTLAFLTNGLCVFFVSKRATSQNIRSIWWLIWLGALVAGCIFVFTPGSLSSTLYTYDFTGRLLLLYHANPYFVAPTAFSHDPVYAFFGKTDSINPSGPLWTVVSAGLSAIATNSQSGIALTFRLFAFSLHLFNLFLVAAILRARKRPVRVVAMGSLLYAWNPLLLIESSLAGHNDLLLISCILVGALYSVRAEQSKISGWSAWFPPLLAFTLAMLVSWIAVPLPIFYLVLLFRRRLRPSSMPDTTLDWRLAWSKGITSLTIFALLIVLAYSPFWSGHSISSIVTSLTVPPSSMPALNSILFALSAWQRGHALPVPFTFLSTYIFWNGLTGIFMLMVGCCSALVLWRIPTTRAMLLASLVTLAAFIICTPWFFPGYVACLVALAVVCIPVADHPVVRALAAFTLLFSATALLSYYTTIVGWRLLLLHPSDAIWPAQIVLVTSGIPILLALVVLLRWPFNTAAPSIDG